MLTILLELLECLPLPLMVQQGNGRVVAQNSLWQQYYGEFAELSQSGSSALKPQKPLPVTLLANGSESQGFDASLDAQQAPEQPERHLLYTSPDPPSTSPLSATQFRYLCLGTFSTQNIWAISTSPMPIQVSRPAPGEPEPEDSPTHFPQEETLWLVWAEDWMLSEAWTQELAARNADLIQLNRLKDEFLACVTHELKTPLTAILGLSSLLKDQLLGTLNDRQSRYIHMIHQSGRQLMKVVNDILDLTRLETGQIELIQEPVDVKHVCERAIAGAYQLHDQLRSNHPSTTQQREVNGGNNPSPAEKRPIGVEIEPGVEWVIADESRLRQMLINLLANALKFTEPGDDIGIRVNRWQSWVAFNVWDTGIGIPEDKQGLIFQKFQQLEHPLTRQFEGLGLGLVITQLLARLHGGDISFTSQPGQGSTFTILLPNEHRDHGDWMEDEGDINPELFSHPSAGSDRPVILIAHTQPNDLSRIEEQAKGLQFRITVARSGLEVLEKARRLQPAAIILNPALPLLSGRDVLTLLKVSPDTKQIPVILLAMELEQQSFTDFPLAGRLSLPLTTAGLQETLDQLFQPQAVSASSQGHLLTFLRLVNRQVLSHPMSIHPLGNGIMPDLLSRALERLMHAKRCQILEVDDLEQADLLARIWKPQLMLMETLASMHPEQVVQFIKQSEVLSGLPIISFVPELSAQIQEGLGAGLSILPYETESSTDERHILQSLTALLQTALGIHEFSDD